MARERDALIRQIMAETTLPKMISAIDKQRVARPNPCVRKRPFQAVIEDDLPVTDDFDSGVPITNDYCEYSPSHITKITSKIKRIKTSSREPVVDSFLQPAAVAQVLPPVTKSRNKLKCDANKQEDMETLVTDGSQSSDTISRSSVVRGKHHRARMTSLESDVSDSKTKMSSGHVFDEKSNYEDEFSGFIEKAFTKWMDIMRRKASSSSTNVPDNETALKYLQQVRPMIDKTGFGLSGCDESSPSVAARLGVTDDLCEQPASSPAWTKKKHEKLDLSEQPSQPSALCKKKRDNTDLHELSAPWSKKTHEKLAPGYNSETHEPHASFGQTLATPTGVKATNQLYGAASYHEDDAALPTQLIAHCGHGGNTRKCEHEPVTSVEVEMLQVSGAGCCRWTSDACAMKYGVEVTQMAYHPGRDGDVWTNQRIDDYRSDSDFTRSTSCASIEVFKMLPNNSSINHSAMTSQSFERHPLNIRSMSTLSCCSINTLDGLYSSQWRHCDVIARAIAADIPLTPMPCVCGAIVSYNRSDCPMTSSRMHLFPVDPRPHRDYVMHNRLPAVDGSTRDHHGVKNESAIDLSMGNTIKQHVLGVAWILIPIHVVTSSRCTSAFSSSTSESVAIVTPSAPAQCAIQLNEAFVSQKRISDPIRTMPAIIDGSFSQQNMSSLLSRTRENGNLLQLYHDLRNMGDNATDGLAQIGFYLASVAASVEFTGMETSNDDEVTASSYAQSLRFVRYVHVMISSETECKATCAYNIISLRLQSVIQRALFYLKFNKTLACLETLTDANEKHPSIECYSPKRVGSSFSVLDGQLSEYAAPGSIASARDLWFSSTGTSRPHMDAIKEEQADNESVCSDVQCEKQRLRSVMGVDGDEATRSIHKTIISQDHVTLTRGVHDLYRFYLYQSGQFMQSEAMWWKADQLLSSSPEALRSLFNAVDVCCGSIKAHHPIAFIMRYLRSAVNDVIDQLMTKLRPQ